MYNVQGKLNQKGQSTAWPLYLTLQAIIVRAISQSQGQGSGAEEKKVQIQNKGAKGIKRRQSFPCPWSTVGEVEHLQERGYTMGVSNDITHLVVPD